jgi:hypothetical protein
MKNLNLLVVLTAALLFTADTVVAEQRGATSGPAWGTTVKPGQPDTRTQDTKAGPGGSPGVEGSAGTQSGESKVGNKPMKSKTRGPAEEGHQ